MATFFAYAMLVLIWATTPLAIQWSSHNQSVMWAVFSRTLLALMVALLVLALLRRRVFLPAATGLSLRQQLAIYAAASLGIFPNMPLVYWSAQFIPSGLIAVILALSPFATGVWSLLLLRENPFTRRRTLALLLALVGLLVIVWQQLQLQRASVYGVGGMVLSCLLFSGSSVLVKKLGAARAGVPNTAPQMPGALQQTTGALLIALPGVWLCYALADGIHWPVFAAIDMDRAFVAVLYLALVGSLLGGALFFFILQRLSASVVSLITLITPVLAVVIGRWLAQEVLMPATWLGIAGVLCALLLYGNWGLRDIRAWRRQLHCLWLRVAYGCLVRGGDHKHPADEARERLLRLK